MKLSVLAPALTPALASAALLFSFSTHATILLDLNADDLLLADGTAVTNWGPATASGTPTYRTNQTPRGFAAVEFNGSDHFGTLSASNFAPSASGDLIFAGLIKATNTGAYHNIIDDDAENRPMLWIDPSFNYELNFGGGSGAKDAGTGIDGWDVFIANSRTNELWINSADANATGGGPISYLVAEAFDLFNRDGGQSFQGLVADLRVYNDAADFGGDYGALYTDLSSKLVAVPEPGTLALLGLGLAGLGMTRRRQTD